VNLLTATCLHPKSSTRLYSGTPPWDIGRPQPAFQALADAGELRGRVLDIGCGTGEHTLISAQHSLEAVGIDSSPKAIEIAKHKARKRGLNVRFLVHNALDLASIGEQFDTVLDSGLFHVFSDEHRAAYVESLKVETHPGTRYFMLCFSEQQPGDFGPRRVTQQEIRQRFSGGWQIESIEMEKLDTNLGPVGIIAWLACITRKPD
jgi:cyclopropane fatty-acyl-phospholipid synthase-like methyltransferase